MFPKKTFSWLLWMLLPGVALAQVVEWQTFTSTGAIRDLDAAQGSVWAATNGGAVRVEQSSGLSAAKFTNTDGMAGNDIVAVEIDKDGTVWLAQSDGLINLYFPQQDRWELVQDYAGEQISEMVAFGDSLYIALGIGVSLYTIDKREVKETYQNFGFETGGEVEKIAANSVFLDGTDIWVATPSGIARSSITLPNLLAPASWTRFEQRDGLPSEAVNGVVVLDAVPYAATANGVARYLDDTWQAVGFQGTEILELAVVPANSLFPEQTILAISSSGVFWLDPSDAWARLGPGLSSLSAVTTDEQGNVWIGQSDIGISSYDLAASVWNLIPTNSPASNDFKSMTLDSLGRLWSASQNRGIQMYDGESWTNFSRATGLSSNDYRTILADNRGRIWAGSWGGGITLVEETSPGEFALTEIDTAGDILSGFIGDPGFVLVNGLAKDAFGNIWIVNREAVNTRVLVSYTPDDEYVYFSTNDGIISRFINSIVIDQGGRVWLGTDNAGIQVIDHRGTLLDPSDDDFSQGLTTNDGLFRNEITALAEDRDGTMWIGTSEGLHFWVGGFGVGNQFGIISNAITNIGVDGRNNKWIGTINGVTVLRQDREKVADFTTGNSPLVSRNIQSFAFNEITGEVWIGTDNGLSKAQTLFTAPKEDLSQLSGFPNPYIIDGSGNVFTITNLAENTSVSIYNSAGSLIKTFQATRDIEGAQAFWNGTDKDGELVASGIYVYLAYTDNNISASGKVAVIRR